MPRVRALLLGAYALAVSAALLPPERAFLDELCATTNVGAIATFASVPSAEAPNWCAPGSDPCTQWHGVACTGSAALLRSVELLDVAELAGTLPPLNASTAPAALEVLRVRGSALLSGTLPSAYTRLFDTLHTLELANTALSGTLPSAWLAAPVAPSALLLSHNRLSGTLPSVAGALDGLRRLDLGANSLSGTVAPTVAALTQLTELTLAHNALSGALPVDLCTLTHLSVLRLDHNRFTDPYPACIEAAVAAAADVTCDLRANRFCSLPPLVAPRCSADVTATYDRCSVCGGDGTSCADCAGVLGGTRTYDVCGVCGGDATACVDCAGVANGDAVYDACDVCNGDSTSCADCAGTVRGTATYDLCGVCGGDSTSCLDCAGGSFGTAVYDACGVCNGDSTTCTDCTGAVAGTVVTDACGVCGGDNASCADCAGVAHGTAAYDACDVCGGDNTSCVAGVRARSTADGVSVTFVCLLLTVAVCAVMAVMITRMPRRRVNGRR